MPNQYFKSQMRILEEVIRSSSSFTKDDKLIKNVEFQYLLENVAYLGAQLKKYIDEDESVIVETLISQLARHVLRPIPSSSILQFEAKKNQLFKTYCVQQGAIVESRPISQKDIEYKCKFALQNDCIVQPIILNKVSYERTDHAGSEIKLLFKISDNVYLEDLHLNPLVIYIDASNHIASYLYWFLTAQVELITYQFGDNQTIMLGDQRQVKPFNFSNAQKHLKENIYEQIKSFFSFPEKYFFISINGVNAETFSNHTRHFSINIKLSQSLPNDIDLKTEVFKINCAPISNIFKYSAEPIYRDGVQSEYPLIVDSAYHEMIKIQGISEISSINIKDGRKKSYSLLGHDDASVQSNSNNYYYLHTRQDKNGHDKQCLIFSNEINEEEVVSCLLEVSNGFVPQRFLRNNAIVFPTDGIPSMLNCQNINPPSHYLKPPNNKQLLWYFLGHLNFHLNSLCAASHLKLLLSHCNWTESVEIKNKINGILSIQTKTDRYICRGVVYPLLIINIDVEENLYDSHADIFVFFEMVRAIFLHFVLLNILFKFEIVCQPSMKKLVWPILFGKKWIL